MKLRFGSLATWALALASLCGAAPALAQGVQTGTIVGDVTGGGAALPGVLVTAQSASAPGARTAVTGATGEYVLRGLIPGDYTVTFALDGMQSVERRVSVTVGATARADAAMDVQEAAETLVVLGESPSALETTTTSATFRAQEVDTLSLGQRDLDGIAALAPGLTTNTPNSGQLTISGAFAYDNVFLVDGVDVNDNLFGTANNLFIEDAIDETQVLTSGISAEYGRFSGGVVNAITKSGGNSLAGSLRADFSKPDWRNETPFEKERGLERKGDLSTVYQATLGGPILRDRLWFFLAGRTQDTDVATTRPLTGVPALSGDSDDRYQVKLTANLAANHTVQATYTDIDRVQSNNYNFSFSIDPRTTADRQLPNDGFAASWGACSPARCSPRPATRRRTSASVTRAARARRSRTRPSSPSATRGCRPSTTTTAATSTRPTRRIATTSSCTARSPGSRRRNASAATTSREATSASPRPARAATRSRRAISSTTPTIGSTPRASPSTTPRGG